MKKMEYVSPEMEIVEIKTQCSILAMSEQPGQSGGEDPNKPEFGD